MAENPEKSITAEEEKTASAPDQPQADFVLQSIVSLANDTGIEMGITLSVGGLVVSGLLISGKKYFEEMANELRQSPGPADQAGVRQSLSDYYGNFGTLIYKQSEDEEQADTQGATMKRLPVFIHLSGAKFFHNSGQPMPSNRGLRWRGRISAVDGFSLGEFSAS